MFFHLPQSEFKLKRFRRKDLPRYEIREKKKKPVIAGRWGCFIVEGLYFTIDTLEDRAERNLFPFPPSPPPPICASKQMSPNETTYWETTTRRCPRLPSICQSFSKKLLPLSYLARTNRLRNFPNQPQKRVICRWEKVRSWPFTLRVKLHLSYLFLNLLEWFRKDINGLHVLTISIRLWRFFSVATLQIHFKLCRNQSMLEGGAEIIKNHFHLLQEQQES